MKVLRTILVLLLWLPLAAMAKRPALTPAQPATSYPAVEIHEKEKVAIAVVPYDTREQEKIFRVDYLKYNILPVRLIITNLGDKPISLREARILFEPAKGKGEDIQAAEPEDVERKMTTTAHVGEEIPMPLPLPPIHRKPKSHNKAIEQDFDEFEYQALVVEPHTTRAGFLFYDISGISDPLKGAKMHIFDLRDADGKRLFYFEIPFDKYLQSKSSQMD